MAPLARGAVATLLLVLLTSGSAHAQLPDRPWGTVGLGSGAYSLDGAPSRRGGFVYGGLRHSVTETFLLGAEASVLFRGENSTHTVFSGMADLYPSTAGGFFLKAGLGLALLNRPRYGTEGYAALVWGLGYDIRMYEKVSLTPFLDGGLQPVNTWWQFGLAASFH